MICLMTRTVTRKVGPKPELCPAGVAVWGKRAAVAMQHNNWVAPYPTGNPETDQSSLWQMPSLAENPRAAPVVGVDVQREPWQ